jgi:hypothetical protein
MDPKEFLGESEEILRLIDSIDSNIRSKGTSWANHVAIVSRMFGSIAKTNRGTTFLTEYLSLVF